MDIKLLDDRLAIDMIQPSTQGSAGYDLRACIDDILNVYPGEVRPIKTGIALDIQNRNMAAFIFPRSGLGRKGLILANTVGLIDSDYQGELIVNVWNRSELRIEINPLDRIAQLVFMPVYHPAFNLVGEFKNETQRGINGHGHTGV